MNFTHGGTILGLLFAASSATAAGIECSADGGRIVDSQAAAVWVAMGDVPGAITDDPETQAAMAASGVPVMSPDDFCMYGWVLPAPHPGDPEPAPSPTVGVRPAKPRPVNPVIRTLPVNIGSPVSASAPSDSNPAGVSTTAAASEPNPAGVVVVVPAADEPTPTPATPAPVLETRSHQIEGCSAAGATSSALWSALLLAGLRRRRGGR